MLVLNLSWQMYHVPLITVQKQTSLLFCTRGTKILEVICCLFMMVVIENESVDGFKKHLFFFEYYIVVEYMKTMYIFMYQVWCMWCTFYMHGTKIFRRCLCPTKFFRAPGFL